MQRTAPRLLIALAIGALLASCGNDDTESVETEPAVTDAPTTEPPATEPPATEPPATEPPTTEPPATEPPATEPPVTEPAATEPASASTLSDPCTVLNGPEVSRFFADAEPFDLGAPSEAARFEQAASCGYLSAANQQHGFLVTIGYDPDPAVAAAEIEKYARNEPLIGDFDAGFAFLLEGYDPVEFGTYAHADGTFAIVRWFVPDGTPGPDELDLAQYLGNVIARATT